LTKCCRQWQHLAFILLSILFISLFFNSFSKLNVNFIGTMLALLLSCRKFDGAVCGQIPLCRHEWRQAKYE
jgi:hypothetical protein